MSGELVPYIPGEEMPESRAARRRAWAAVVDYRVAPMKPEEPVTLPRHVMEQLVELDGKCRKLRVNDPALDSLLADIDLSAVRIRHPRWFRDHDFSFWD
jgi:cobalamin biosynthesis Mg chelatase CobN